MGNQELAAVVLGLTSALSWGGGDFCGGLATRRASVLYVLLIGQGCGMLLMITMALVWGEPLPSAAALGWSIAAGAAGACGLAALYQALSAGSAALVAPLSAVLAAALPVLFSALTAGLPGPWQIGGFAAALLGIWLIARGHGAGGARNGLGLALLAGCSFGAFFILIHWASAEATFWPLAAARATALVLTAALVVLRRDKPVVSGMFGLAMLSGLLDVGGNLFFVLAGQAGRLDVAAILSSLYPASTVLLSRVVLGERVSLVQRIGLAATFVAIALIAS